MLLQETWIGKILYIFAQLSKFPLCFSFVRLYLINFPHQIGQLLKQTFRKYYLPGVASEATRDASAIHEIVLQGPPWSQNSSYNLHARSMLMMMIKDLSNYGWKLVASSDATAKYVISV